MTNAAEIAANLDQASFVKLMHEFDRLSTAFIYGRLAKEKHARYYEIIEILDHL